MSAPFRSLPRMSPLPQAILMLPPIRASAFSRSPLLGSRPDPAGRLMAETAVERSSSPAPKRTRGANGRTSSKGGLCWKNSEAALRRHPRWRVGRYSSPIARSASQLSEFPGHAIAGATPAHTLRNAVQARSRVFRHWVWTAALPRKAGKIGSASGR